MADIFSNINVNPTQGNAFSNINVNGGALPPASQPVSQPIQYSQPQQSSNGGSNPLSGIGNALGWVFSTVGSIAKSVVDFIPQIPTYLNQAKNNPGETAAGAGSAILQFGGSIAGAVEHGIVGAYNFKTGSNIVIPERWDITKQTQALSQLNDQLLSKENIDQQHAFATGQFIGQFLPYALSSETAAATIGEKLLVPTAEKFLPGAIKFIPTINNAIGFLGVGQIEHDSQNGSRVDQFRNDLIMLSMFEIGGLATKGLSGGTKNLIKATIDQVKDKPVVNMENIQPDINEVKTSAQQDLGKPLAVEASQQIATGNVPEDFKPAQVSTSNKQVEIDQSSASTANTDPRVKQLFDVRNTPTPEDAVLNPIIDKIGATIKDNGTSKGETVSPETKAVQPKNTGNQNAEAINPEANQAAELPNQPVKQNSLQPERPGQPTESPGNTGSDKGIERVNSRSEPANTGRGNNATSDNSVSGTVRSGQGLKVSKIAKEIEAKAVEKGFIDKGLDKLAGFNPQTFKEQSKLTTDLINNHFDDFRAIIKDQKPLPNDINPSHLVTAAEEYLAKNPQDIETLQDLAKSSIVSRTSEAAQTLGAARTRDAYSPIALIKQLQDDKKAVIQKQYGESIDHVIKKEVVKGSEQINKQLRSNSGSKSKLADFIKGIQC